MGALTDQGCQDQRGWPVTATLPTQSDCSVRVIHWPRYALAADDQPQARERAQGESDANEPDLIHSPKRGDSEQRADDQGRDKPQADE